MKVEVKLDKAGRVTIPKRIRDKLHLSPGETLYLESKGQRLILKPSPRKLTLQKKHGMWVASYGVPMSVEAYDKVLESVRDERDAQNLGLAKRPGSG